MGNERDNGMTDVLVHLIKKKKRKKKRTAMKRPRELEPVSQHIQVASQAEELIAYLDPKDSGCN